MTRENHLWGPIAVGNRPFLLTPFFSLGSSQMFLSEFLLFLCWNENWSASIFVISCLKPFLYAVSVPFFYPLPLPFPFCQYLMNSSCVHVDVYVVHKICGFCFLHTLCLAVLKSFRLHRFVQSSWDVFCDVIGKSDLICLFFSYSLHRSLSSDLFIRMRVRPPTPPTPLVNTVILTHSFLVNVLVIWLCTSYDAPCCILREEEIKADVQMTSSRSRRFFSFILENAPHKWHFDVQ